MDSELQTEVLGAENQRCAAMMANDLIALDALLDPDLRFSHATGAVDDKSQYLAKLQAGRIQYLAIDWSETHIRPFGEHAALLSGRMRSTVKVEGVEKQLDNRVLAAWTLAGSAWRLAAFQSTPLKA